MDFSSRGGGGCSSSWATGDNSAHRTDWQVTPPNEEAGKRNQNDYSYSSSAASGSGKAYSPDGDDLVKVVLLGAPGVGKTAIVQQFVWGNFEPSYFPTSKKETYYPSVVLHDQNYSLKIVDIPDIPYFPVNSFYNISDLQGEWSRNPILVVMCDRTDKDHLTIAQSLHIVGKTYGLRDANAYVLVYDLLAPDSFDYITNLFNQISESRDLHKVPVVVVGNKTDKVNCTGRSSFDKYSWSSGGSRHRSSPGKSHHHDHHDSFHDHHDHHHHDNDHHHDDFHNYRSSSSSSKYSKHSKHHGRGHKYGRDSHKHSSWGDHGHHNGHGGHYGSHSGKSHRQPRKFVVQYEENNFLERDIADKVKSEWNAIYKECSAHESESVSSIFRALMEVIEENGVDNGMEDEEPRKCTIL